MRFHGRASKKGPVVLVVLDGDEPEERTLTLAEAREQIRRIEDAIQEAERWQKHHDEKKRISS